MVRESWTVNREVGEECHDPRFTIHDSRRYARHVVLPDVGEAGQQTLLASSALVIGAGGLGSAAIAYLAAAGVGRLGIVEPDRVELSNLQRQVLYEEADIGRPKAEAARDRIEEVNPGCQVELFAERLTDTNAKDIINRFFNSSRGEGIILDGSDNFATRFALAAACAAERKTLISAAISGFSAHLSTFKPYLGAPHPCYRCLVPHLPEREIACAQEGIIGPLAGILGSMQALEAVKEVLGIGKTLSGRLLVIDALSMEIKTLALKKDPGCVCAALPG